MRQDSFVELINIRKHFPNKDVLNGINFRANKGEFIAIIGNSGCGKSTLLNILGMLDVDYDGEYYFEGELVSRKNMSYYRKNKIGFIFQLYYLIPSLTVLENIKIPFLYKDKPNDLNDKISDLVQRLKISEIVNVETKNLSGGEKQRVAISRALVSSPEILICDEPTGNLDIDNTNLVIDTLIEEKNKGTLVIVVTHSLELAKRADCIYRIDNGVLNLEKSN